MDRKEDITRMTTIRDTAARFYTTLPQHQKGAIKTLLALRFNEAEAAEIAACLTYKAGNGKLMVSRPSLSELEAIMRGTIETTIRTRR